MTGKSNEGGNIRIDVQEPEAENGPGARETDTPETNGAPDTVTIPAGEYNELLAQIEDFKDRYLRTAAEFDNYRKRQARERDDLICYANERLISQLLPILDNLERALDSQPDQAELEGILEGVRMVSEQLQGVLRSCGLEAIQSVGDTFDPNLHEAVGVLPSPEHPEGQVVSELQKGYSLKGRVLRPSMVHVAGPGDGSGQGEED